MPNIPAEECKSSSMLPLVEISSQGSWHLRLVLLLAARVTTRKHVETEKNPISLQHKTGSSDN
jgi:hypothetical protein